MYVIILLFLSFLFNGSGKVMYFFVFSRRHSNFPSNSSANSLIIKWKSYLELLWNTKGIPFGALYLRLETLWAAPLTCQCNDSDLWLYGFVYLHYQYYKFFLAYMTKLLLVIRFIFLFVDGIISFFHCWLF